MDRRVDRRALSYAVMGTCLVLLLTSVLVGQNTVTTNPRVTGVQAGSIPVGTGTAIATVGGTLFWTGTPTGNLADTNWVISPVYALPANTLTSNGDRLEVEAIVSFSATVSTKSVSCRVGYTAFDISTGFTGGVPLNTNTTSSTTASGQIRGVVTRISATTASHATFGITSGGVVLVGVIYDATSAITWGAANNIACAVKDSAGIANSEIIQELRVTVFPR